MATFTLILNVLAAIPKVGELIMQACGNIALWYVQQQNNATLSQIADAAAFAARAKTDEDRFKAAELWQTALSRSRESVS